MIHAFVYVVCESVCSLQCHAELGAKLQFHSTDCSSTVYKGSSVSRLKREELSFYLIKIAFMTGNKSDKKDFFPWLYYDV